MGCGWRETFITGREEEAKLLPRILKLIYGISNMFLAVQNSSIGDLVTD